MEVELSYFVEKDLQWISIFADSKEKKDAPFFDKHIITAKVNGEIFRESFIITKNSNPNEAMRIFGISLQNVRKMIVLSNKLKQEENNNDNTNQD